MSRAEKKLAAKQKPISQKEIILNFAISATLKTFTSKNAFIWSSKSRKLIHLPTTCHGVLENRIVTRRTSKYPPLFRLLIFLKLLAIFKKSAIFKAKSFRAIFKVVQTLEMYCSAIYKTLYANSAIFERRLKEQWHFQAVKLPKFSKTPITYRWSLTTVTVDICRST